MIIPFCVRSPRPMLTGHPRFQIGFVCESPILATCSESKTLSSIKAGRMVMLSMPWSLFARPCRKKLAS